MITLKVGIISQTLVQQHHLRQIVEECGYQVADVWLIDQLLVNLDALDSDNKAINVWLVDVDTFSLNKDENILLFERWLFDLKQPVIFGEGNTFSAVEEGFSSWVRQLKEKLLSASSQLSANKQQQAAECVWVLAASTGGPEAVKQFLDRLPSGLGLAFVYVQHIETQQNRTLANTISRDSQYTSQMANHGDILCADTVTVVSSSQQLDIFADGTLVIRSEPWRGKYQPSIDQVVATVADRFGSRGGAIFFSGMGEDGMVGARLMARRSGKIWVQTPATCASDSMPNAIKKTGAVTTTGSPEQLADYLARALRKVSEPEPVS